MIKATPTERTMIRDDLYSNHCSINLWPVDGELWACDVAGIITEHHSVEALLSYLIDIAQES